MATSYAKEVSSLLKNLPAKKNFQDVLSFQDFYDQALAQAGIQQQLERFFQPQVDQAIEQNVQGFQNRGLLRSGMRGAEQERALTDIAGNQQTYAEQLAQSREAQARNQYAGLQSDYEKSPTSFNAATYKVQPSNVTRAIAKPKEVTGTRYGLGRETGTPYAYGQSYRDWYTKKYGKLGAF